jgi:hypothetical protein
MDERAEPIPRERDFSQSKSGHWKTPGADQSGGTEIPQQLRHPKSGVEGKMKMDLAARQK